MMKFDYTEHVEEIITERKLSKQIVEDIIKNPDKVIDSRLGRKIAQKVIGNKLLRVIYEEQSNAYIIITAYSTKPERYR
ncbi:MAG: DUF4258 domain-containing protein [Candidatus Aenigmarchaeota archaeon]|nr:DUF4258 domain-containing protein [Candidatus Aenigmarchaeota archaeon]